MEPQFTKDWDTTEMIYEYITEFSFDTRGFSVYYNERTQEFHIESHDPEEDEVVILTEEDFKKENLKVYEGELTQDDFLWMKEVTSSKKEY